MKISILTAVLCFLLGLLTLSFLPQVHDPFCDLQRLCSSNELCKDAANGLDALQIATPTVTPTVASRTETAVSEEDQLGSKDTFFKDLSNSYYDLHKLVQNRIKGSAAISKSIVSDVKKSTVDNIDRYSSIQNAIVSALTNCHGDKIKITSRGDAKPKFIYEKTYELFEPENVILYQSIKTDLMAIRYGDLVLRLINSNLRTLFKMSNICVKRYQRHFGEFSEVSETNGHILLKNIEIEEVLNRGQGWLEKTEERANINAKGHSGKALRKRQR